MCGIYLHISKSGHVEPNTQDAEFLLRRGPDALCTHKIVTQSATAQWYLTFSSSVLSLRGHSVQGQPVVDDRTGSILCWNGEAWFFDNAEIRGNDTQEISKYLFNTVGTEINSECATVDVFNKTKGPYAFVFYNAVSQRIYFGRDALGRRSLLINDASIGIGELTISSIATGEGLSKAYEVGTMTFAMVDLSAAELAFSQVIPRPSLPRINKQIPTENQTPTKMPSAESVSNLVAHLRSSLQIRVNDVPTYAPYGSNINPSRVAIMFSGGLDCTLLARLTHDILPYDQPIDLLNVAFENPRVVNAKATSKNTPTAPGCETDTYETCPDRMTGRASFAELIRTCPERSWRFVAINIPYTEYTKHQATIIRLMHPHNTEMDLSITSALYFAARGQGMATISTAVQQLEAYTTSARVLLSGLGADELFGGYARHAASFTRGGYQALIDELELDFARISSRNLGRDDRVIAHWGRETRYPFLDETFVDFALGLPALEKCGFRPGKSVSKHFKTTVVPVKMQDLHPEKMLLRCAMWQLGMKGAAAEKKRAIQFGARTAKMHAGKTKGTDAVTVDDISGR